MKNARNLFGHKEFYGFIVLQGEFFVMLITHFRPNKVAMMRGGSGAAWICWGF
jgi:hypothetical protein